MNLKRAKVARMGVLNQTRVDMGATGCHRRVDGVALCVYQRHVVRRRWIDECLSRALVCQLLLSDSGWGWPPRVNASALLWTAADTAAGARHRRIHVGPVWLHVRVISDFSRGV